jgi:predicted GIY-YIG superfamily endonuclease
MWFVYVLKSISSGKHYVGIAQDVNKRLQEHNAGKSKFTSFRRHPATPKGAAYRNIHPAPGIDQILSVHCI